MENERTTVPYIAFESALDKAERRERLHIFVIIFLITLLVLSNLAWIIAWNQYDYTTEDYSVEIDSGSGIANYIGNDGDINNAANSSETSDSDPETP